GSAPTTASTSRIMRMVPSITASLFSAAAVRPRIGETNVSPVLRFRPGYGSTLSTSLDGQDDVRRLDQGREAIAGRDLQRPGALERNGGDEGLAAADIEDDLAVHRPVLTGRHRARDLVAC